MLKTEIKQADTKTLLERLRQLCEGAGESAWEKCLIIQEIFTGKRHFSHFPTADDRTGVMQQYADTFGCTVAEAIQMIECFPNKKDWQDGRIRVLKNEAAKRLLQKKTQKSERRSTRLSWKDKYEELKEEHDAIVAENRELKARLNEVEKLFGKQIAQS